MKNDAKFEEELACQLKIDIRNLTNFDLSTQNLKYLHFNTLFLTQVCNVWAKKNIEKLRLMALNIDATLMETWLVLYKKFYLQAEK